MASSFLAAPLSRAAQDLRTEGLVRVTAQGILAGILAGALIGVFRLACDSAGRNVLGVLPLPGGTETWTWPTGLGVVGALFLLGLCGVLLTHRYPHIAGSGIPQVELTLAGNAPLPWKRVVAGKFVATWISLTGGLSVGREGPCIYMGAALGEGLRSVWPKGGHSLPRLCVAGSVAGLTAAFGAPLGGLIFAFEEMKTPPKASMLLCAFCGAAAAYAVVSQVFGFGLVFPFAAITPLAWPQLWLALVLGLMTGLLGTLFNSMLLGAVAGLDRWASRPGPDGAPARPLSRALLRGLLPFFCAGGLLYAYPQALELTGPTPMALSAGTWSLVALAALFAVKLVFSVLSFASGMSGGLLMPILLMGSMAGACLAGMAAVWGYLEPTQTAAALAVCMAGFFGASVRAPLTGAALVVEMCGAWTCLPEILVASGVAAFIATRLGSPPVYEALRQRARNAQAAAAARKAASQGKSRRTGADASRHHHKKRRDTKK